MAFDILLKNGTVFDAVSNQGYLADLGVSGNKLLALGNLQSANAAQIIDVRGKFVCPGFIDIQNHSDSYLTLLEHPGQESLLAQGITTIAIGHCGSSLGPLPTPEALRSMQKWRSILGVNLNWLNFGEFLKVLENLRLGVNVLGLIGHATLRRGLLGDQVRVATFEEIQIMKKLLQEALAEGAGGMSLGLVYAHEVDASRQELLTLGKIVAAEEKLLSIHLRSEARQITQAVSEALGLAADSKARLKIAHFKIRGSTNWGFLEEVLAAVDKAYQKGVDVFFDVYPYTTTWTVLYTYLPIWAYEGGRQAILQNLKAPAKRAKILNYLTDQHENLKEIFVAMAQNPAFVGKTLKEIAANQEISVEEALLVVIAGTEAQALAFDHNLSPQVLEVLLKHPLSVVATDGAGYDFDGYFPEGLVHPRCFGTMPKFLSMVREKKLLTWPEAIKKITSRPAQKLGLAKRGKVLEGNFADLVVFDPHDVGSKASYQNPYIQSDGIDYVILNGELAVRKGEVTSIAAGKVLRV